ncbi:MAG: hypothetical protein V8Q84_10335 [Bilophila sp.]
MLTGLEVVAIARSSPAARSTARRWRRATSAEVRRNGRVGLRHAGQASPRPTSDAALHGRDDVFL